jgi:hypothetical protein
METHERDVVICIPTKRKPPLTTLMSYETNPYTVIILADPEVYIAHQQFYPGQDRRQVVLGQVGQSAQTAEGYRQAALAGFPLWFKMDDDLPPKSFIHKDGHFPGLIEVIDAAYRCSEETGTTLVGFHNGANRSWMLEGNASTWGLIHGAANLSISTQTPEQFVNPDLPIGEDIWRTLTHREQSGNVVGRVRYIGFNKKLSTSYAGNSTNTWENQERVNAARDQILARFPGKVSCVGTRLIFGNYSIPNWRMRK